MRTLMARTKPVTGFRTAEQAISHGSRSDRDLRTVNDAHVGGEAINAMIWDDRVLSVALCSGMFLNLESHGHGLVCTLGDTAPALSIDDCKEDVRLELDGIPILWRRSATAARYVQGIIERLWFQEHGVLVYVRSMPILACYAAISLPNGDPLVYWEESD